MSKQQEINPFKVQLEGLFLNQQFLVEKLRIAELQLVAFIRKLQEKDKKISYLEGLLEPVQDVEIDPNEPFRHAGAVKTISVKETR